MLRELAKNLWLAEGPVVRFFGMPFPTRMVVVRLSGARLWVHSPIRLDADLRREIEKLGRVTYLISPNKIHHLFMGEWKSVWPDALLYASPFLRQRRADLEFDADLLDTPDPAWAEEIDQVIIRGSRVLEEAVFLHRASRTLILGDLIENFPPDSLGFFMRLLARWGRVLAPHGETPRDLRATYRDRARARQGLQTVLDWQPRRVVMCHGEWLEGERVRPFLENAFAWAWR